MSSFDWSDSYDAVRAAFEAARGEAAFGNSQAGQKVYCEDRCRFASQAGIKVRSETHSGVGFVRFVWLYPNGAQQSGPARASRQDALYEACQLLPS